MSVKPSPPAATLVEELRNFTIKVMAAGTETFAALDKVGLHDDLTMACAIAVWRGENRPFTRVPPFPF